MFESKRSTAPRIRAEDEHMQRWLKARTERRNWIELRRDVSSVQFSTVQFIYVALYAP